MPGLRGRLSGKVREVSLFLTPAHEAWRHVKSMPMTDRFNTMILPLLLLTTYANHACISNQATIIIHLTHLSHATPSFLFPLNQYILLGCHSFHSLPVPIICLGLGMFFSHPAWPGLLTATCRVEINTEIKISMISPCFVFFVSFTFFLS